MIWTITRIRRLSPHPQLLIITLGNNVISKSRSLEELANFYFSQTPYKSFEKGRKYYQEAIEQLNDTNDEYLISALAGTYRIWGLDEIQNGFVVEGKQKIERARKYYNDLKIINGEEHIREMDDRVKALTWKPMLKSLPLRPQPQIVPDSSETSDTKTDKVDKSQEWRKLP